jgi:hypothetical protein
MLLKVALLLIVWIKLLLLSKDKDIFIIGGGEITH